MELPEALRHALDEELEKEAPGRLMADAQTLSMRYRAERAGGSRLLTQPSQALAYATTRMPATYAAVYAALREALAETPSLQKRPVSLLDAGAGTGAASWAAASLLDLREVRCLEREEAMHALGRRLMRGAPHALMEAEWLPHDLCAGADVEKAEVVVAAYVLNEIEADQRLSAARALWKATGGLLLVVEPGTPVGFANLLAIRNDLAGIGADVVAPCPETDRCPIRPPDWCHFVCRVARSKMHRLLKQGEAPYEDEKFTYMAFARKGWATESRSVCARVLRHPQIHSGFVTLSLCTRDGLQQATFSKRNGDVYKRARKAQAGDALTL